MNNDFNGRRLPVYLVLDVSGSMAGEPVEACRQGVKALLSDLRGDPQALETAYLSVITFESDAKQVAPLCNLMDFAEPTLTAGGSTGMGAALELLASRVDAEVRQSSPTQKGDWKPLVFLMTDGQPTDEWEAAADKIRAKRMNVIACAAGPCADTKVLQRITETVIKLANLEPDQLKMFFKWVSSSVRMTSTSIGANPGKPTALPALPADLVIVP